MRNSMSRRGAAVLFAVSISVLAQALGSATPATFVALKRQKPSTSPLLSTSTSFRLLPNLAISHRIVTLSGIDV